MERPQPTSTPASDRDRSRRRRLGQFFTPPALVDELVALALAPFSGPSEPPLPGRSDDNGAPDRPRCRQFASWEARGRVRVLDPACGDGRFLGAVGERLGAGVALTGCDVDEHALALAGDRVPGAELLHADALAHDWGERRFDLVIGNPPFLGQLATATSRRGRSRFGGGPYADAAAEFLALATQLADPAGGRVALVLPQSILTTRDAGPIRERVAATAAWRALWWSTTQVFDAAVHTCAVVFERGAAQGPVVRRRGLPAGDVAPGALGPSWGALLLDEVPVERVTTGPVLGDIATVTVDFRDQYYGLVGHVADDADGPPLVTAGLIDPGVCHWGVRPVRFAKQRFAAPRVDLASLDPALQDWARRRLVPKVLVANQTRAIESVIDRAGAWLPSVPVLSVVPHDPARLDELQAVLASDAASAWVRARAAGSGLSASSIRLTPALLAGIPLAG